jgi:hypothetical protein
MKIKEMQVINRESPVSSLENDIFADAPGNNEEQISFVQEANSNSAPLV